MKPYEKRKEVINFIREYNRKHGGGGQIEACRKWSLSWEKVSGWLAAEISPSEPSSALLPLKSPSRRERTLQRMAEIEESLIALRSEYSSLKSVI